MKRIPLVLVFALFAVGAHAQSANDMINMFGGIVRSGVTMATQSAWEQLPPSEVSCIDLALREQGSSVNAAIHQGIGPADSRVGGARAACRDSSTGQRNGLRTLSTNYIVDGLNLGGRVAFGSAAYASYSCSPSEQFASFTVCRKKSEEREARGTYSTSNTILHSSDGTVAYINRYLEPAFFGPGEADADIDRLSKKYGAPRILKIPPGAPLPLGMIVSWGEILLEPLDPGLVREISDGRDVRAGYMVDHIGNYRRSAQLGLPIYRLAGGPGYVWVGNWGSNQKGTLRFFAANPAFYDRASAERMIAEQDAARKAAESAEAARLANERAIELKASADRAAAQRIVAENAAADRAAAERAAAEKAAADRSIAEKAGAEKVAAEKVAAEKAVADEAMRRAEKELAIQKEATEKGGEYASASGTTWTVARKKNEMTDGIDTTVKSIQSNDNVVVEVTGACQAGDTVFSGLVVNREGKGLNIPGQNDEIRGAPVLYRIDDKPPGNRILPSLEFANKFELLRLSTKMKTDGVDDLYRNIGSAMGIGPAILKPAFVWRIMVEIKTTAGSVVIKLPLFNEPIRELIKSCGL